MTTPAVALLADIRDSEFESAWIYTMMAVFIGVTAGVGIVLALRQVRAMWSHGARMLAVAVGAFAGGAALLVAALAATLLVNFIGIASGPGGTP